jgi:hypothetical protein
VTREFRRLGSQQEKGSHEVVDDEDTMIELLNKGWKLVRELNGNKFLMKRQ